MTLKFINKLHNQRVLILGGSTGIGFAVAEAAVEHGANMIISSSNQNKLDRAVKRLEEHIATANLPARHVSEKTCDRSSSETMEDNIKSLLQFATEAGKIDDVVFTAGDAVKPPGLDKFDILLS
ncbi:hypothetical protein EDB81DRAFT_855306 [Dactylonectria macrodidyma]|uniref:Uncharacterized protein n=1 Tax=Dactylonectria macrodidyma TaxID=307937 RepID=A0A9P9JBL4_9HYPO|nr:hypothetical protein EDB81DRAFT_855306 [Dactylonectria macrodidyma]